MNGSAGGGASPSVVFCGTPEEAVPSLEAIASRFPVPLVVTRPDRRRGRGQRLSPPPVKVAAERLGLAVSQPADRQALFAALSGVRFDLGVVVAFGMILPPPVLALAPSGFLNLHFSLLPRWRGASPVEAAILAGDTVTGVTVMLMDAGLDTGPVLAASTTPIAPGENAGTLRARLADMGAGLVADTVESWWRGELVAIPQEDEKATNAPKLGPGERLLSSSLSPTEFERRVRALAPTPGALLDIGGITHKILAVEAVPTELEEGRWQVRDGWPAVGVRGGGIVVREIHPPGGRAMPGDAWLRGHLLP